MNQATVDVSVPTLAVITKLVPAVLAVTAYPDATATVPSAWQVRKMSEFAVTAVVLTVAVPLDNATEPKLLAPADVVVPTLALNILLPDVWNDKLPVTFTLPDPASKLTDDVEFVVPIVTVFTPDAVAILTALVFVLTLAMETVVAPAPFAINTLFVPELDPNVIAPV